MLVPACVCSGVCACVCVCVRECERVCVSSKGNFKKIFLYIYRQHTNDKGE